MPPAVRPRPSLTHRPLPRHRLAQPKDLMPLPANALAATLAAGRLGLTLIVKELDSPAIARAAQHAGFDALYVDLEYGVIQESAVGPLARAAHDCGITPLVRLPGADPACAARCLAAGASGLVVPKIATLAQVQAMVAVSKCAPLGHRPVDASWFGGADAALPEAVKGTRLNAATTLVIMLESPEALALAEPIAATPGVDIVHIGTSDLSRSLGIPDQYTHPSILAAYTRVIGACRAAGKTAGAGGMTTNHAIAQQVIGMGARFMTGGNELHFLVAAAKARVSALRALPLA